MLATSHQSSRLWRLVIPVGLGIAMLILVMALLPAQASAKDERSKPGDAPQTVANGDVITIGVAQVLSGGAEGVGWPQLNAVQLAADQVNDTGGIDIGGTTYTVALVVADSLCSFSGGMYAAADLVASDVVAVVGHSCSGSTTGGQTVYDAAGIAMISGSATGSNITEGGYTTTFRTITRDDTPPARLATMLHNHIDIEKVALVEMGDFVDTQLTNVFSDTFTSLGGQITSRQHITETNAYTDTLTQIDGEGAEAILFNGMDALDAGTFSAQAAGMGMSDVQIAWAPSNNSRSILTDYESNAGDAAEGDIVLFHQRDTANMPGYAAFSADYIAAGFPNYGDEPGTFGAFAYDAAQILFQAIDNADSTDPGDIRNALAASGYYDGVVGEYFGFDDKGDVIPQWYWFETFRDGEWGELVPVGLVADGPTFDDGSFNMMSLQGLTQAKNELLVVGETFISTSDADYQPNLEQCAENGNALCLSVGFGMNDATLNAAENYPATKYAILDGFIDPSPDNVRYITFAHDEVGYLAGVLAGEMTTSDIVGAVGGWPIPPVEAFVERYGHAATCANPAVTPVLSYTNSFGDPYLGAVTAQDQMALGADVIFAAAGATGNGAVLTATQSGAWGIGVDSDQYISLFESGAVAGADRLLSSAMKRIDNATFQTIEDVVDGLFTPGEYYMNLANEGVGLAPFHETEMDIPAAVKSHLLLIEHGIISGDIDPYGACYTMEDIYLPLVIKSP